jgi:predicted dehydrogenase
MQSQSTRSADVSDSRSYWSSLARLGFYREDWVAEVAPAVTTAPQPLKYALIGCGLQATTVVSPSAERAGFHLTAVCDLDRAKAERATHGHADVRVYTDYDHLLRETDAEAVFVCGPPDLHHGAGLAVLQSGRHLFTEKPPAWRSGDLRTMQDVAAKANRRVAVGLNKRHALLYRHAREVLRAAPYGAPGSFRMSYSHWPVSELRDQLYFFSIHAVDLCLSFMGPVQELAIARAEFGGRRSLTLCAKHSGGGMSQLALDTTVAGLRERVELSGDEWVIVVDDITSIEWSHGSMMSMSSWKPHFAVPGPSSDSYVLAGYVGEMAAFHRSILGDDQPESGLDAALKAIQVLEWVMESPEGITHRRIEDIAKGTEVSHR